MITQLSAKYQFCAIHTADTITTAGKVTNRALLSTVSEQNGIRESPPFILAPQIGETAPTFGFAPTILNDRPLYFPPPHCLITAR